MIKTEKEFDECVRLVGGIKISDLVGASPDFNNADYLFEEYRVVAELKCLEEDKIKKEGTIEKASAIYLKYLNQGKAPYVVFGTVHVTGEGFPSEFNKEIMELYRKHVKNAMKKANKQIRETKGYLKSNNHHGILILVNDGHTALDPSHVIWIISETLRRDGLSSINSVLYLTVNLKARHTKIDKDILVWVHGNRHPDNKFPEDLLDHLREVWHLRVKEITGVSVEQIEIQNHNLIYEIDNIKT